MTARVTSIRLARFKQCLQTHEAARRNPSPEASRAAGQASIALMEFCRRAGIGPEECAATMSRLAMRMGVSVPDVMGLRNDEAAA